MARLLAAFVISCMLPLTGLTFVPEVDFICYAACCRPLVPKEYVEAGFVEQFTTAEEIQDQIDCIIPQIDRLRWRASMDWLTAQRFVTRDILDYRFFIGRSKEENRAADVLQEVVDLLQQRLNALQDNLAEPPDEALE